MATYTCNRDGNAWQLYTCEEGAEAVATLLSEAVTREVRAARKRLEEDDLISEEKLGRKLYSKLLDLLNEHSSFGAADTEPRGVLAHEIEKGLGLDPYTLG